MSRSTIDDPKQCKEDGCNSTRLDIVEKEVIHEETGDHPYDWHNHIETAVCENGHTDRYTSFEKVSGSEKDHCTADRRAE
ncbi:MAG TPA: hypothetical protein VI953_04360 [Candidatus Paceibacterota bacterium]